ncbi:hypothetical protein Ndes2437B_g07920 [Nannochloris sp. 'desiccata']
MLVKTILMPWNIVTSGLLQDSLIGLVAYVVPVLFFSRSVEAVQGQPGFLKSILLSIAAAGGLTFFLVTFIYYVQAVTMAGTPAGDSAGDILYDPICGFQGGLGALLVGVKQAIPDKDITMLSFFQFKTKDLPGLYLVVVSILGIVTGSMLKLVPFALFGSYTAWFYLRFFAYRADSFLRGDPSPEFSFASFFPAAAQPTADKIAKVCLGITTIDAMMEADAQNVKQSSALLLGRASPSKDSFEANRRRERGARALEERLGMKGAVDRAASAPQGLATVLDAQETGTVAESTQDTEALT